VNVVSYIRVSSKGQLDGDGLERQRTAIEKFCKTHSLNDTFEAVEPGVSGDTEASARKAFSDMLDLIDLRKFGPVPVRAVVVEKLDRLARDLMVSEFLLTEFRKREVKVFATDQELLIDMATNAGDPTRKLIRQILGALSEWEKSQLVRKLRAARQRKKEQTGRCEGGEPYGYSSREKSPGQNAKERSILELMRLWRETMSNESIAKLLNDGGFLNRFGKPFTRQGVLHLIKNNL